LESVKNLKAKKIKKVNNFVFESHLVVVSNFFG